jgi:CheY-like chemotaxis protein
MREMLMNELKGKRIFIVEDDVTNMAIFMATLRRSGAIIIQDFWNADTTHILQRHLPVDIILLDLMLRHSISGYEIADKIRAIPELKNIPVCIVSAADPDIEIPRAQKKGMAGFIGKPIDPMVFPEQVAACINGDPVWFAR